MHYCFVRVTHADLNQLNLLGVCRQHVRVAWLLRTFADLVVTQRHHAVGSKGKYCSAWWCGPSMCKVGQERWQVVFRV